MELILLSAQTDSMCYHEIMSQNEKQCRKRKKVEYAVAFDAVRTVIHQWDPYSLLAHGCPADEFDSGIKAVVRQLNRIVSQQDAAYVVSRVFSSSFEPEGFRFEDCQVVGEELYRVLKERRILPD